MSYSRSKVRETENLPFPRRPRASYLREELCRQRNDGRQCTAHSSRVLAYRIPCQIFKTGMLHLKLSYLFRIVQSHDIIQFDNKATPYNPPLFTAPRTSTSTSHVRVCWISTVWLEWLCPSQLVPGSFVLAVTVTEVRFAFGNSTNSSNLLC
jgi:hypothetical protein